MQGFLMVSGAIQTIRLIRNSLKSNLTMVPLINLVNLSVTMRCSFRLELCINKLGKTCWKITKKITLSRSRRQIHFQSYRRARNQFAKHWKTPVYSGAFMLILNTFLLHEGVTSYANFEKFSITEHFFFFFQIENCMFKNTKNNDKWIPIILNLHVF